MLGRPWQVCVGGLGLAPRGEGWLSFGVWMAWSHEALPIPGLLAGRVWVGQWASSQQGKGLTGPGQYPVGVAGSKHHGWEPHGHCCLGLGHVRPGWGDLRTELGFCVRSAGGRTHPIGSLSLKGSSYV